MNDTNWIAETNTHWIVIIGLLLAYLLPTVIAFMRGHQSRAAITVINVFFGWTIVGWLWAFIWSLAGVNRQAVVVVNHFKA